MSLRGVLSTLITAVALLGAVAALLLVLTTSMLHSATLSLGSTLESVRIAEESRVALLLHSRSRDPLERRRLATQVERLLADARLYSSTADESALIDAAEVTLARYFAASDSELALLETFDALEELTNLNVEQARGTERRSTRIDRVSNLAAVGFSVLLLAVLAAGGLTLRSYAIKPLRRFSEAIRRFGTGETSVRIPETGPSEIKEAAARFNELADDLGRQRAHQLAFLGGVAHDLRNPLSALRTATALWAPGRPPPAPERTGPTMELVRRQIERLDRMVGDFLDATRVEAGQLELRLGTHDLVERARASFELFRGTSPRHSLELSEPAGPLPARCDAFRIEQVLNNLLSNAIKYSPEGGTVRLALERRGEWAALTVSDQGIGIEPDDVRQLFQPFSRSGASRESIPGVGLGLYIVRMIVAAHGGRIEVDSEPGAGSAFTVLLPLAGPAAPAREQPRA